MNREIAQAFWVCAYAGCYVGGHRRESLRNSEGYKSCKNDERTIVIDVDVVFWWVFVDSRNKVYGGVLNYYAVTEDPWKSSKKDYPIFGTQILFCAYIWAKF